MSVLSMVLVLCAAIPHAASQSATAALIAQDNFEAYSTGDIIGQGAAGSGWAGAWSGLNSSNAASIPLRNVSAGVMGGLGQSLELGFSALQAAGSITNNNIAQRVFDSQSGTVYVGLAIKTSGFDGDGSNQDFFQLYVNDIQNETGTAGSQNSSFSAGVDMSYFISEVPGAYILRKGGGGGETVSTTPHTNLDLYRLVLKLSKSTGVETDPYDQVDLYINQPTEGTPNASRGSSDEDLAALGANISVVHMRVFGLELDDRVFVDNLRIATTYAAAISPLPVVGDFDSDGDVDGADFVAWQTNFPTQNGATRAQGDADADGDVDGADFAVWQTNFPLMPEAASVPVPEPLAITLMTAGNLGLVLVGRRWGR